MYSSAADNENFVEGNVPRPVEAKGILEAKLALHWSLSQLRNCSPLGCNSPTGGKTISIRPSHIPERTR
jgi:hypothetical protein